MYFQEALVDVVGDRLQCYLDNHFKRPHTSKRPCRQQRVAQVLDLVGFHYKHRRTQPQFRTFKHEAGTIELEYRRVVVPAWSGAAAV
jgi:hypothetical protein